MALGPLLSMIEICETLKLCGALFGPYGNARFIPWWVGEQQRLHSA